MLVSLGAASTNSRPKRRRRREREAALNDENAQLRGFIHPLQPYSNTKAEIKATFKHGSKTKTRKANMSPLIGCDGNHDGRNVLFDTITVHEHAYALGDNPSVSEGAPLTIEWEAQHSVTFDIGYYEIYRPSSNRKPSHNLRLSVPERAKL